MTTQEQLNKVQKRISDLDFIRRKSDSAALKCEKDGLVFRNKYPQEAAERDFANSLINDLEIVESRLMAVLAAEEAEKEPGYDSEA